MFTCSSTEGFLVPQNNQSQYFDQRTQRGLGGGYFDVPKKSKVFIPVTIKMILESEPRPDDICEFEGEAISDIILAGRILCKREEPTRTQFEINDNTGTFLVTFYHKQENQVPTALKSFEYQQFMYAKIYANIRVFKEQKAIIGTHIKEIKQYEEITNHFLTVFITDQIRKKGVLKNKDTSLGHSQNPFANEGEQQMAPPVQQQQPQKSHKPFQQMNEEQLKITIMNVISVLTKRNGHSNKGAMASKDEIYHLISGNCTINKLNEALESLVNEGKIVQATDPSYYFII